MTHAGWPWLYGEFGELLWVLVTTLFIMYTGNTSDKVISNAQVTGLLENEKHPQCFWTRKLKDRGVSGNTLSRGSGTSTSTHIGVGEIPYSSIAFHNTNSPATATPHSNGDTSVTAHAALHYFPPLIYGRS